MSAVCAATCSTSAASRWHSGAQRPRLRAGPFVASQSPHSLRSGRPCLPSQLYASPPKYNPQNVDDPVVRAGSHPDRSRAQGTGSRPTQATPSSTGFLCPALYILFRTLTLLPCLAAMGTPLGRGSPKAAVASGGAVRRCLLCAQIRPSADLSPADSVRVQLEACANNDEPW